MSDKTTYYQKKERSYEIEQNNIITTTKKD